MATYQSIQLAAGVPTPGFGAGGGQERTQHARVQIPAGATTADLFNLFYLPPNATVLGGGLKTDDLDTGTTVTFNVGDTGGYAADGSGAFAASANRYFAAQNTPQAGGYTNTFAVTGRYFQTGKKSLLIQLTLGAGPTTTAGFVDASISYTVEEPQ